VKSTSYRQIRGKRGGGMWTVGQQPPCLPINQRQLDIVPIPLDGPDRTRPEKVRGLSGRVRVHVVEYCTGRARLCRWSGLVVSKFNHTDPWTSSASLRPDQTHGQSPYMLRLSGQVYDQTKSADLSETRAVRGSGLVGSVYIQWNLGKSSR